MESPVKRRVHEAIEYEDGANAFFLLMTAGCADYVRQITDLEITIDGSSWTDREDDVWSTALRAFAPLSANLEHLHIIIKGNMLFTRFNYVRPLVNTRLPFGYEASNPDDDENDNVDDGDDDDDDSAASPCPKNKPQPTKHKRLEVLDSALARDIVEYRTRVVPPEKVELHITGEKAIISALLSLDRPVPRISIHGYMELGLRRRLIAALNPDWRASPECLAQAGLGPQVDAKAVEVAERREQVCLTTGANLVRTTAVGAEAQKNGEYFCGLGSAGPSARPVPTSAASRQVYGWRAMAVQAWRGPPVQREE